jgi:ArsR family transcriptional regulator, arsenate/arsenite/antimonite-responsive transcriptional repressor
MDNKSAIIILASIAQEARLEIFRALVQAGAKGMSAGVISERLRIPNSTLSFHLKELSHAGLVNARQESRFIYYSANYEAMNNLLAYLTENCCVGEQTCCAASTCETIEEATAS